MNQTIHEQLSALMDGELERDETRFLLKRLATDQELPLRWSRYHVTRQTLRRQELSTLPASFADGVMARIDANVMLHVRPSGWLRWGAGGAIAASVAVAALVLTRPAADPASLPGPNVARIATAQQAAPINVAPVSATTATSSDFRAPLLAPNAPIDTAPVNFGSDLGQSISNDPHLQSYLIRHYQNAGSAGQSGFVPYVLLAPQHAQATATPAQQNR